MSPDEIARRLSPAQKRALLWLPGDGGWQAQDRGKHQVSLWRMEDMQTGDPERVACWRYRLARTKVEQSGFMWRLTPLGQAVRAIVAKEAGE